MAPSRLVGQVATTSQDGRYRKTAGLPLKVSEMMATIPGAQYVERVSVHSPAHIRKAKKAIKERIVLKEKAEALEKKDKVSNLKESSVEEDLEQLRENIDYDIISHSYKRADKKETQLERDILKKAVGIFSKSDSTFINS